VAEVLIFGSAVEATVMVALQLAGDLVQSAGTEVGGKKLTAWPLAAWIVCE